MNNFNKLDNGQLLYKYNNLNYGNFTCFVIVITCCIFSMSLAMYVADSTPAHDNAFILKVMLSGFALPVASLIGSGIYKANATKKKKEIEGILKSRGYEINIKKSR